MTLVSGFCFLLAILILLSMLRRGSDPLSPTRVFGLVWAVAIGLADLKLSHYQHEWSIYSWIVFLLGISSFLVGVLAVAAMYVDRPLLSLSEVRRRLQWEGQSELDERRLYWSIVLLFIAYGVSYAVEVVIEGNVPLFSPRIERARIEFGVFGFHLIVDAMLTILILVVEYFLLVPRRNRRSLMIALVFLLTTGSFFLLLQRYNFFVWAVISFGLIYYCSRHVRLRNILIVGGVFLGMLMWIQSFRLSQYVQHYHYVVSRMKYSPAFAPITEPYMYIVMNLENFTRAVDQLDTHFFGYFTLDWAMALVGLKHWLASYFNIDRLPFLVSGYNTFTFHWWYYYDFGIFGVATLPFLMGFVIALCYYRLRTEPTILVAMLYAIGLLLMVISYTMNPMNRLDFVSNVFLLVFLHLFILRKPRTG